MTARIRGPLVGAALWAAVSAAAGNRCQCQGNCGSLCSKPRSRESKKDWDGRCLRTGSDLYPLHAVPREPVKGVQAMALPAAAHDALCDQCHRGVITARNRAEREAAEQRQAASAPLFDPAELAMSP